jgi:hypothetical protein
MYMYIQDAGILQNNGMTDSYIHTYIHIYIYIYIQDAGILQNNGITDSYIHTYIHIYIYIYIQDAGILQNNGITDPGTSAPDPNSRRSMARFQTYLDNTFSKPPGTTAYIYVYIYVYICTFVHIY